MQYITKKQQELMMEIYYNKNRTTKKEQRTYPSHFFYNKVSQLKNMGLVESRSNGESNIYSLTIKGSVLVRILLGENWLSW